MSCGCEHQFVRIVSIQPSWILILQCGIFNIIGPPFNSAFIFLYNRCSHWHPSCFNIFFLSIFNKIIDEDEVKRTSQLVVAQGIAHNTFVMQLGAPFRGIRNCPIHVRALFAIFASAASYDRDTMDSLQRQMAASAGDSGKLNFTGVDKLVEKYENADFAQWLNPRHAYVTTWMASLLLLARNSGVVAMSEILWLKPVDRRLWYILNKIW